MKAVVDQETCTGCGLCVDACGDVFELEGEVARVKVSEVPEGATTCCQEAADDCPVDAISVEK